MAGQSIGRSKHVTYLELLVFDADSREAVQPFCQGLVLNQSIKLLVFIVVIL